jgi:hypothetical protein
LISEENRLKNLEIQNSSQIALLQQKWAKFESEKNEISEAKIMLEAQARQGRA